SKGSADQPLDFLRPPADLSGARFALRARARSARQHAVLRRHPALAGVAEKGRHSIFDARGADHARATRFDQRRSFGVLQIIGRDRGVAKLIRRALVRSHWIHSSFFAIGRRRSTWPASVSTSFPSTSSCTAVTAGRFSVSALTMV